MSLWTKAKDYGREWFKKNGGALARWVAVFLAASLYNKLNGPGPDGDVPVPIPPDIIWPEAPFGWVKPVAPPGPDVRRFESTEAGILTFAADDEDLPLWRLYAKGVGQPYPARQQGAIGSCVAMGSAGAVEVSLAVNVALVRGPPQKYDDVSREAIYGGGRVNIRRDGLPPEGMVGEWAAEWLNQSGAAGVSQGPNPVGPYDPGRARQWGNRGVPADVVALGRENPVQTALVRSAEDVKKALANGYACFVCSTVSFGRLNGPPLKRDADGFLYEDPRDQWPHCMFVAGYRGDKRAFLIVNSWGEKWVTGPKGFGDEPEGAFWCRWDTLDKMVRTESDSFAVSGVGGFRRRLIQPRDWLILHWPDDGPRVGNTRLAFGWINHRR